MVKSANGAVTLLGSIATVEESTRNSRSAAWFNGQPAVIINITKQADANVIETVDRIHALLPELKHWVPAGVHFSVLTDRTLMIRASVRDMQLTLGATIVLVMLVVFVFLRRLDADDRGRHHRAAVARRHLRGHVARRILDRQSVADGARGLGRLRGRRCHRDDRERLPQPGARADRRLPAAVESARQIGFTVISISVSLVAAFIPLLFMGGLAGRLFREFSVTLVFAIAISTLVSLSVTPMICAHYLREAPSRRAPPGFDRLVEGALARDDAPLQRAACGSCCATRC